MENKKTQIGCKIKTRERLKTFWISGYDTFDIVLNRLMDLAEKKNRWKKKEKKRGK